MGTVLEMRYAAAIALICALSACGNQTDSLGGTDVAKALFSATTARATGTAPGNSLGLTRQALEQVVTPVQLATIDQRGQQALLGELEANQDVVTWSTLDDVTVSFRNGVIVATRGLGNDLMAAAGPAVQGRSGTVNRVYTHLNGEDQPVRRTFACTVLPRGTETIEIIEIAYVTSRVSESCTSGDLTFQNDFWLSSDQKLRKSRQWISEDVGFLTIEDLRR